MMLLGLSVKLCYICPENLMKTDRILFEFVAICKKADIILEHVAIETALINLFCNKLLLSTEDIHTHVS